MEILNEKILKAYEEILNESTTMTTKEIQDWAKDLKPNTPVVVIHKNKELPIKAIRLGDIGTSGKGLVLIT